MVKAQKSTQQQVIPSSAPRDGNKKTSFSVCPSVFIKYMYYITDPTWDSTGCVCIPEAVPERSMTCPEHTRNACLRAE